MLVGVVVERTLRSGTSVHQIIKWLQVLVLGWLVNRCSIVWYISKHHRLTQIRSWNGLLVLLNVGYQSPPTIALCKERKK